MARDRDRLVGTACAVGSAAAFAVTIVVQRRLATTGIRPTSVLSVRFGIASLVLLALLAVTRRPLRPAPGERLWALGLGAVAYAVEAGFFYLALERGSAGAVALLFYSYPALVTVLEVATGRQPLRPRTVVAVGLSMVGAALVVVAGDEVDISAGGVAFAFAAAGVFSGYLIVSSRVIRRSEPRTTAAWVAGGASLSLFAAALLGRGLDVPAGAIDDIVLNGVATAFAFALLYAALLRLSPGPAAVVMTLEAFGSVALAAIVLNEVVAPLQLLGGVAIVGAAATVALESRSTADAATPPDAADPGSPSE